VAVENLVVGVASTDAVGCRIEPHRLPYRPDGPGEAGHVVGGGRSTRQHPFELVPHGLLPLRGTSQLDEEAGEGGGGGVVTRQQEDQDLISDFGVAHPILAVFGITGVQKQSEHVLCLFWRWPGAAFGDDAVDDLT
jgi:hypothetical protein